jgi:hypothetical protein
MPPSVWIALCVTDVAESEARAFAIEAASGSDSGWASAHHAA